MDKTEKKTRMKMTRQSREAKKADGEAKYEENEAGSVMAVRRDGGW